MVAGGEFVNDTIDGVFRGTGANHDKVGASLGDLSGDEAVNAASEREDKHDSSNTNSNTKRGEKSASTIKAKAADG